MIVAVCQKVPKKCEVVVAAASVIVLVAAVVVIAVAAVVMVVVVLVVLVISVVVIVVGVRGGDQEEEEMDNLPISGIITFFFFCLCIIFTPTPFMMYCVRFINTARIFNNFSKKHFYRDILKLFFPENMNPLEFN